MLQPPLHIILHVREIIKHLAVLVIVDGSYSVDSHSESANRWDSVVVLCIRLSYSRSRGRVVGGFIS